VGWHVNVESYNVFVFPFPNVSIFKNQITVSSSSSYTNVLTSKFRISNHWGKSQCLILLVSRCWLWIRCLIGDCFRHSSYSIMFCFANLSLFNPLFLFLLQVYLHLFLSTPFWFNVYFRFSPIKFHIFNVLIELCFVGRFEILFLTYSRMLLTKLHNFTVIYLCNVYRF